MDNKSIISLITTVIIGLAVVLSFVFGMVTTASTIYSVNDSELIASAITANGTLVQVDKFPIRNGTEVLKLCNVSGGVNYSLTAGKNYTVYNAADGRINLTWLNTTGPNMTLRGNYSWNYAHYSENAIVRTVYSIIPVLLSIGVLFGVTAYFGFVKK